MRIISGPRGRKKHNYGVNCTTRSIIICANSSNNITMINQEGLNGRNIGGRFLKRRSYIDTEGGG
jgi:hypothetical protein